MTWSDLDNESNIQTFNLFYECACVLFNLSTALAKQAVDYLQVGILFSVNCSMLPRTLSTMLAIAMPKRQILILKEYYISYDSVNASWEMTYNGLLAVQAYQQYDL